MARPASLIVTNPSGNRTRVVIEQTPFSIGRQNSCHLTLRDNRISRLHSNIVVEDGHYAIVDNASRHGLYVNGERTPKRLLRNSDRIEFGFPDSYKLTFVYEDDEAMARLLEQMQTGQSSLPGGQNLAKLRAVTEVARTLRHSFGVEEVLAAVVDAALTVTGTDRAFLLLRGDRGLSVAVARDSKGADLVDTTPKLRVSDIDAALSNRAEYLSMAPEAVAGLATIFVPLVRVRAANVEETHMVSSSEATAGVLVLEGGRADLSAGNRELLEALALETSTVLENARLLEEERSKERMAEEISIARRIQQDLLPASLPRTGWFRAAASSNPSNQVGGDCYDFRQVGGAAGESAVWSVVVTDVSGKGVGAAILASLLQGAFLSASSDPLHMTGLIHRVNRYVVERAEGEQYATIFFALLGPDGVLHWVNAGHCMPLVLKRDGRLQSLDVTGLPVGMLAAATFERQSRKLDAGDKIVVFSDGLTDVANIDGEFFGTARLKHLAKANAALDCQALHDRILDEVREWAGGVPPGDDITLVVLEYLPQ